MAWTKEEAKKLDFRLEKANCWQGLHPTSNLMAIYLKPRDDGRGLISLEESYAAELRSIDFYLANSEEELLKVGPRLEKSKKDKIKSKRDYSNKRE